MSALLRLVTGGFRSGVLPPRGTGILFDKTPAWIWGGDEVTVDTEVGPMLLPLRDHGPRQILVYGRPRNEFHETKLLSALAPRLACALDIGANVGWFTRVLGRHDVRVESFEPNRRVFPYLKVNAGATRRATAHPLAVGEHPGRVTFFEAESSDLSSASRPVGDPVEVEMTTVDDFTSGASIRPDFIKVDVEGGEVPVLRGAQRVRSEEAPLWLLEVNEKFLLEQGASYDVLEAELVGSEKYSVRSDGSWQLIHELVEIRGTSRNVLVVPPARRELVSDLVS